MKRSGPLKRTKGLTRKARMPRQSKKRKQLMKAVNPLRDAYRKEFPKCQCGCGRDACELHEITAGAAREKALSIREAWLHLASECHAKTQFTCVPYQCALKLLADPDYFNLRTINALRGRAEGAITLADVAPYLMLKARPA